MVGGVQSIVKNTMSEGNFSGQNMSPTVGRVSNHSYHPFIHVLVPLGEKRRGYIYFPFHLTSCLTHMLEELSQQMLACTIGFYLSLVLYVLVL